MDWESVITIIDACPLQMNFRCTSIDFCLTKRNSKTIFRNKYNGFANVALLYLRKTTEFE